MRWAISRAERGCAQARAYVGAAILTCSLARLRRFDIVTTCVVAVGVTWTHSALLRIASSRLLSFTLLRRTHLTSPPPTTHHHTFSSMSNSDKFEQDDAIVRLSLSLFLVALRASR